MRSALFIGVDAVLVNSKKACGLTPTVSKVSSGAVEFLPIYYVKAITKLLGHHSMKKFKIITTDIPQNQDEFLPRHV